jgi:hypothetical protein
VTAQPSTAQPSTVQPSTVQPSTVQPSTVQPSPSAPSAGRLRRRLSPAAPAPRPVRTLVALGDSTAVGLGNPLPGGGWRGFAVPHPVRRECGGGRRVTALHGRSDWCSRGFRGWSGAATTSDR